MTRWDASYAARRAATAKQANRLAELVSEGWSVAAGGREIGVSQQRSSQIWKVVRDGLGAQAC